MGDGSKRPVEENGKESRRDQANRSAIGYSQSAVLPFPPREGDPVPAWASFPKGEVLQTGGEERERASQQGTLHYY